MRATAEVIEGNRVKLSVEVPEDEFQQAIEETMKRLVREVRMAGFRPGKVPRRLLEQRLGAKAIRDEVIRDVLPEYYQSAVDDTELDTISAPEIDITSGEEEGPLVFDAVVEVRPRVSIAGYEGLVVTVPPSEASDEEVDEQIDRLRSQFATLREVDRPARDGDHVTLTLNGTRHGEPVEGLSADDFVYALGSGGLVEGADDELRGATVGTIASVEAAEAPGGSATVQIIVKQVREKLLPDLDDAWAEEASEFDTLEELRADMRERIAPVKRYEAAMALREGAVDALLGLITDDPPELLVQRELEHRVHSLNERLASRRVTLEQYAEAIGETPEDVIAELSRAASRDVLIDLALRALAETEQLEATEDDIDEELEKMAAEARQSARVLRQRLERSGRLSEVRSELRKAKAVAWLLENVGVVDDQGNPVDRTALLGKGGDAAEDAGTDPAAATLASNDLAEHAAAASAGEDESGSEEEA